MKTILFLILPFMFSGCIYFNDRGIDNNYYNQCKEYYDSMGIYHKTCDENMLEYKEIQDGTEKAYDTVKDSTIKAYDTVIDGTVKAYDNTKEFITQ